MNSLLALLAFVLLFFMGCASEPTKDEIDGSITSTTIYDARVFEDEVVQSSANDTPGFMLSNQSDIIKDVQKRLRYLGHTPGSADGVVGPQTSTALIKFQRRAGLTITGQLNKATLNALRIDPDAYSTSTTNVFAE